MTFNDFNVVQIIFSSLFGALIFGVSLKYLLKGKLRRSVHWMAFMSFLQSIGIKRPEPVTILLIILANVAVISSVFLQF